MAIYRSRVVTQEANVPQPCDGSLVIVPIEIVLPAVALAVNDILEMIDLPPGVGIVDYDVVAPQLDSNGTPTLALSIGHKTATATDLDVVYETGLTAGRTANGSVSRMGTATAAAQDTTGQVFRRVALKVTTAAATSASANKSLWLYAHLKG